MVDPSIQTLKGDISIEHLSFAYPDQPTVPVLEDVSVHVKAGETLAVLGRTGSGKTRCRACSCACTTYRTA